MTLNSEPVGGLTFGRHRMADQTVATAKVIHYLRPLIVHSFLLFSRRQVDRVLWLDPE